MLQRQRQTFFSIASWAVVAAAAMDFTGCSAQAGQSRCDPNVEACGSGGAGGATSATTATTTASTTMGSTTTGSTTTGTTSSGAGGGQPGVRTIDNRIVAYLPTWGGSLHSWTTDMPWYRISHVDVAFATATATSLSLGASQDMYLGAFVTAAHAAGAKVLVSIGGAGTGSTQVANLYAPATVDTLVGTIAAYLDAQNLDGIDVDVEGDPVNGNYPGFIDKLVAKVRPKGKLVTAAVAQWFGNNITPSTYAQFDFINVMSYDKCGSTPCQHSTYDAAVQDLNYFKSKGLTSDKLVLGVPFYCHCWGATCIGDPVSYAQVLAKYPGGMDYIQADGLTYSCNGPATIKQKTLLAKGYGGMMVWQIAQDAAGDQSLLKVMADNL